MGQLIELAEHVPSQDMFAHPYLDGDEDEALMAVDLYGISGDTSPVLAGSQHLFINRGPLKRWMRYELERRTSEEGEDSIPSVEAVLFGRRTVAESCHLYQVGEYFFFKTRSSTPAIPTRVYHFIAEYLEDLQPSSEWEDAHCLYTLRHELMRHVNFAIEATDWSDAEDYSRSPQLRFNDFVLNLHEQGYFEPNEFLRSHVFGLAECLAATYA